MPCKVAQQQSSLLLRNSFRTGLACNEEVVASCNSLAGYNPTKCPEQQQHNQHNQQQQQQSHQKRLPFAPWSSTISRHSVVRHEAGNCVLLDKKLAQLGSGPLLFFASESLRDIHIYIYTHTCIHVHLDR